MKIYKLWVEIEEFDTETEQCREITSEGVVPPVPAGSFRTLREAVEYAETFVAESVLEAASGREDVLVN